MTLFVFSLYSGFLQLTPSSIIREVVLFFTLIDDNEVHALYYKAIDTYTHNSLIFKEGISK